MKDTWYGDNRDPVKWTVLLHLAQKFGMRCVFQVLYHRPSEWKSVEVDDEKVEISTPVIAHFRDCGSIRRLGSDDLEICVFDKEFAGRAEYAREVCAAIRNHSKRPKLVFLDPDTGLSSPNSRPTPKHVSVSEVREVWDALLAHDFLMLYQHAFRDHEWKSIKMKQFSDAVSSSPNQVKVAHAPDFPAARDVAFYYICKAVGTPIRNPLQSPHASHCPSDSR